LCKSIDFIAPLLKAPVAAEAYTLIAEKWNLECFFVQFGRACVCTI
jgi:hypothetical protein